MVATVLTLLAAVGTAVLLGPDRAVDTSGLVGPTPERSFIWVKRGPGPFTDAEIRSMASSYSYVVMDRTHAGSSIARQLDEVRRLKQANPDVRVLVYVNAAYWFDTNDTPGGWATRYDRAWSLTDPATGGPLRFDGITDSGIADFVDLGSAAYRRYLLGLIRSWSARAPLDGIAFDSVRPAVPEFGVSDHPGLTWSDVLPPDRIDRYDAGIDALLRDTRRILGPGRDVLVNGIAPSPITRNRNLGYLGDPGGATTALDEDFCLDPAGRVDPGAVRRDLALMAELAGRGVRVLEKTNTDAVADPAALGRLGRLCNGAFLLGWAPGSSYFKFGPNYDAGELTSDPVGARLRLGRPLGGYRDEGGLLRRDFDGGTVLVNLSDTGQRATAGVDGVAFAAGDPERVDAGDTVSVAPMDATVLMRSPSP